MPDDLLSEKFTHTLDLIQNEIRLLRVELEHRDDLLTQRIAMLEEKSSDHETRLRDATNGVTQFRLWSTLSNSGSALMSIAALIKSFIR